MSGDALCRCRARIGQAWSAARRFERVGEVTLRAHQRLAASRVDALLDAHRGCLLADDVGRGKTFVALAVASRWTRPLIVIPAGLRDSWTLAMRRAGVEHPLLTHEALSRGGRPAASHDGIIVDESHHFRNPATRRHAALADACARGELLLMSATPVQNATADLRAQLSLLLGGAAYRLDVDAIARFVVRIDSAAEDAGLPVVAPPAWVPVDVDDAEVLEALLALPPPPRALDAGDAGALRTIELVRAWASSRAALTAAIDRRRRTAVAIGQAVECGRRPTRAELRSWRGPEDAVQLGFAGLLAINTAPAAALTLLGEAVAEEHEALGRLVHLLRTRPDPDAARAHALAGIVDGHRGARAIAFTSLASTARAYHAAFRARAEVGLLTAAGGRIASGRATRRELLERFAPAAHGCAEPAARERLSLLLSTDLLAEGVNLQDASVVVHLDLPWNPARLAQRVGRVRRPFGAAVVFAYLIAPPAASELLLDVERRLRGKLAAAERLLGRGIPVVPALGVMEGRYSLARSPGSASVSGAVATRLARWASEASRDAAPLELCVAAVRSPVPGWLAVTRGGRIVAALGEAVGDEASLLDRATILAEGTACGVIDGALRVACAALDRHLCRVRALRDAGASGAESAAATMMERRLAMLLRDAPRHERPALVAGATALRHALARPLPLGTERALSLLPSSRARPAADWIARALAVMPDPPRAESVGLDADVPAALILLCAAP